VRVLDLTRLYPGAYCTGLLADLGADVVKVEAPGAGDGMRFVESGPDAVLAAHLSLNRGKRSLRLDLKSEQAPDVLRRLATSFDVVVESMRPGMLDGLGIGYDALRAANPALVWCSITGFGSDGPLKDAPGHDITYLGVAGALSMLGHGGAEPPLPDAVISVPLAAMTAVAAITAALLQRDRTGEGCRVEANMFESSMWMVQDHVTRGMAGPSAGWGDFAGRGIYRCADGRLITVTASEPRSWAALCAAIGRDDLASLALGEDEPRKIEAVTAALATKPAADWIASPGLAGGVGPVNRPEDLVEEPQVVARKGIVALDDEAATPVVANPIRVDGADGEAASLARSAPPELGADTDEVLAEAGFTAEEIAGLRADSVV
jgi:crotonobetainyl-CoA:carnitine CoA-transferase CaiB-like acyl-CoA transferase